MAAPTNSVEFVVRRYAIAVAVVLFVGILIGTALLLIKPRSDKLFQEATQAANHGDWKKAAAKAAAAANLDQKQLPPARLAVMAALRANESPLPVLSDRLFDAAQNNYDRYLALRADVIAKRWGPFNKKLSFLPPEERHGESVVELEAIALANQGHLGDAIHLVRQAYKVQDSQKMAFVLAELLFQLNPRPDAEIATLLARVARPNGGSDALAAIVLLTHLPPEIIRKAPIRPGLPALVESLPNPATADFLAALDVERLRAYDRISEISGLAVERFKTHPSPDILRWLIAVGQIALAGSAYDATPLAQQSPDYDDIRVALALDREDYSAARQVLGASKIYTPAQKSLLTSVIASMAKSDDEQQCWDVALQEAQKDDTGNDAILVANAARLAARNFVVARALAIAAETPAGEGLTRRNALEALAELVKERDTKSAQLLVSGFLKYHPDDADFENNSLYLALLNGTHPSNAVGRMEILCEENPTQENFRSTLALAFLRQDQPKEALRILSEPPLSNSSRAIKVAALRAVGKTLDARREAERVDRDKLLPEEESLITGL